MVEKGPDQSAMDIGEISEAIRLAKSYIGQNIPEYKREKALQMLESCDFIDKALKELDKFSAAGIRQDPKDMAWIIFGLVEGELIGRDKDKSFTPLKKPWINYDQ